MYVNSSFFCILGKLLAEETEGLGLADYCAMSWNFLVIY